MDLLLQDQKLDVELFVNFYLEEVLKPSSGRQIGQLERV